jgi:hypothetical protein
MPLRRVLTIVGAFALATSMAEPAKADPIVLDQQHLPPPEFPGVGSTSARITASDFSFRRAQTFTVGREGRLVRVDVLLSGPSSADIRLQILDTVGGVPIFRVLGGTNHATVATDGWWTFDLATGGIPARAGAILGIELVMDATACCAAWLGQTPGGYPRGGDFFNNGEPFFLSNPQLDNFFRTYQDVAPVPEPRTVVLTLFGVLIFLSLQRKRFAMRPLR